ncbi:MAG: flagellar hook-associated protein FlgK [Stappia sp.]|uniref:flagellar hook-associated protein FlgK n=1 Tax=Stappia sp. TaxID=1870903 RepID=UPI000C3AD6AD|nr:flagellar hook-associated protein FlgK [Stappia sp.]MAA97571.1 flagellar hook-associated protein FlgK [Stappia sp.]MBM22103.1 flagellar hook-associated protein FlgK [Stappia sp.]
MGLGSALNTALLGLGFNQRQLDVTAANLANSDTVGYTRKSISASATYDGNGRITGVDTNSMSRFLDLAVQGQYRTSLAQQSYASVAQEYTARLDSLFGTIEDSGSIASGVNNFIASMSNLASGPEDESYRLEALRTAQTLANTLNSMSSDIQNMRQTVEATIGEQVNRVNDLLSSIKDLDRQIVAASQDGDQPVGLMDQRDVMLEELSTYMDIEVKPTEQGGVRIHTSGGTMLYDVDVMKLKFDGRGNINANTTYDINSADRGVGTLVLENAEGSQIDLLSTRSLKSGSLLGLVNMRDQILPDAQAQLDELAASMARAFSTHEQEGTPYPATGTQTGFELDLANMQPGDSLTFDVKDVATGRTKSVTVYRSDGTEDPALTATRDPDDIFLAVDFSSGNSATIAANIQAAVDGDSRLGPGLLNFSNPAGSTLRMESTNPAATRMVSASAHETVTDSSSHSDAFALFTDDDGSTYTGMNDGRPNVTGFASRIRVSQELLDNPSLLVEYTPDVANGDPARPQAILDRLQKAEVAVSPATRIGGNNSIFKGTISELVTASVSHQSGKAAQAKAAATGQDVVTSNLKSRLDDSSKVNVDQELAQLVTLQNAYAANARVMQVVRELYDILMRS